MLSLAVCDIFRAIYYLKFHTSPLASLLVEPTLCEDIINYNCAKNYKSKSFMSFESLTLIIYYVDNPTMLKSNSNDTKISHNL